MKTQPSGTQADMYEKCFPGEAYTTTFEPSPEQREAMTRHAQSQARDGDELKTFMMAFGLMDYDVVPERPLTGECVRGHDRSTYSRWRSDGYMECKLCKRMLDKERTKKARA